VLLLLEELLLYVLLLLDELLLKVPREVDMLLLRVELVFPRVASLLLLLRDGV
jgi:hypothetical protein